jgi:hypothetical protein
MNHMMRRKNDVHCIVHHKCYENELDTHNVVITGADPGFLERGVQPLKRSSERGLPQKTNVCTMPLTVLGVSDHSPAPLLA